MKTVRWSFVMLVCSVLIFSAFVRLPVAGGTIKGKIIPAEGALKAWVISESDTIKVDIVSGLLEVNNLKAGIYSVSIETVVPYKPVTKADISVKEGDTTDIGEIKLEQ